ncbi:MAG TPA: hybrid sensor histidine kinase/response regulator [Nannocystaceae bacterium]|nr:hybrid sensor histidine kinase/response regulator [Nannocystaceae bacterium]
MDTPVATVLVVDDNAENRALAEAILTEENYRVLLATGGEEGVAMFERERPDCVLLDVRMPGVDGFEACRRMRALDTDIPIIFLTAQRDLDTFDTAQRTGADDFLTKPVRPTELALRVQAAVKLRRMGSELREHWALIRRQRDDLLRMQLQKEQLIAFVVHDLKNPVNSMDLQAQLLARIPDLPERARAPLARIRDEARVQLRLILNLLDIAKSEEGRLAPVKTAVDLDRLAADVLGALELRARDAEVTLESALDVHTVSADPDLLLRVLENLVENAIRHAPSSTSVRLLARAVAGGVELRVADAGIGIPPEAREKVFDRFVQLEGDSGASRTSRGLGLAFCKHAVLAHGGRIHVEDAAPGAAFCIFLPDGQAR